MPRLSALATDTPELGEDATQNIDLVPGGQRAPEQPPQTAHEVTWISRVEKFDIHQHPLQMRIQPLHLVEASGGLCGIVAAIARLPRQRGKPQLIAQNLDGGCEIERGIFGVRRNGHQRLTEIGLLIGEPAALAPEDECDGRIPGSADQPLGGLARQVARPLQRTRARGRSDDQGATLQRRSERIVDASTGEQVIRARGPRRLLGAWIAQRSDQSQVGQAHCLHRAGRRADIAGVRCIDENDANIVESGHDLYSTPSSTFFIVRESMSTPPLLNIAVKAARAAGRIILRHAGHVDSLTIRSKEANDFVSEVDHAAEQEIVRIIRRAYPSHAILAEEGGATPGDEYEWIIDPLDGTTNFLHGFPQFAVSIAVRRRDRIDHAVVYDPIKEELFSATRGGSATLNGRRIRVTQPKDLSGALLGTGIPFRKDQDLDLFIATLRALLPETAGVRRAGSAALDLAYLAAGRLDGFWEIGLKPWDMAAGILLIEEAGGMFGDLRDGRADCMKTGNILAAPPKVFDAMRERLKPVFS